MLHLIRTAPTSTVSGSVARAQSGARSRRSSARAAPVRATGGAMQYLRELIGENFFSERRSVSDVRSRLEDLGHIYPVTHISTPMRRLVHSRELRRLRQG